MSTITLSIGRDCNGRPLDAGQWEAFQAGLLNAVSDTGLTVVFAGEGPGFWQPEDIDGTRQPIVVEDSFTVIALGELSPLLRTLLADLADRFGQEAIALTTGETELVAAAPLLVAHEHEVAR